MIGGSYPRRWPPLACQCLTACNHRIGENTTNKVTDDCGFNVDGRLSHFGRVSNVVSVSMRYRLMRGVRCQQYKHRVKHSASLPIAIWNWPRCGRVGGF